MSCTDESKTPVTVRIFSYFENFSGSYTVDEKNSVEIQSHSSYETPIGKKIYYSEFHLGEIESLSVSITTSTPAEFLAIRVYENASKVKEATISSGSTLTLIYHSDE
ncbi:MAG: hypothetical protein N2316_10870 [Spirochaetes bacterium]|nr:hypothetical protein [Spirochaetota bacterium]